MRSYISMLLAFALIVFSGCFKDPKPQPCMYDACSYKAPALEIAAVQHYLDSMNITDATQHCSGLFYKIENAGTGIAPEACSNITVNYKGMLTNGSVFDSSSTGADLYLGRVIRGWTNGLPLIKAGGKMKLYIPSSLGYGKDEVRDRNNVLIIPANSVLIFDVELLQVY